jgi:hypothetical protein
MENSDELSRNELLALKEVRLTSRLSDNALAQRLIKDNLIIGSPKGYLKLTAVGQRMLVRGSPSLWTAAS